MQRTDLNPIEEATGYSELIERFGYTQEQLAEVIGKSRSHLANTLRLLKLPDGVQALVQDGQLTAGHARALIGRDDAETLARQIVEDDLNVREVEALVQEGVGEGGATVGSRAARATRTPTRAPSRRTCPIPRPQGRDQARLRRERHAHHQVRQLRPARLHPRSASAAADFLSIFSRL